MDPGEIRDEEAKYIKDLEKNQKKTTRSIKKSENRISKAERSIDKSRREIPRSDSQQDRTSFRIAEQEAVVQKFADKLQTVKDYK